MQVDYYTTESVVSVDWENGFVEASAKENENVNKVNYAILSIFSTCNNSILYSTMEMLHVMLLIIW